MLAVGNSNGDLHMLRFAESADRPSLSVLIRHDDREREYEYDKGARRVLKAARQRGWTIVSMKDDWKVIFP
ncbi:MAG: hypothetical protein PHN82_08545 [bacterium]|nr:hypothetical protein [bacterium]